MLLGYARRYTQYPYHSASLETRSSWGCKAGGHLYEQTLTEASSLARQIGPAYDLIYDSGVLSASEHERIRDGLLRPMLRNIDRNKAGKSNWQTWHNAALIWGGALVHEPHWIRKAITDDKNGFYYQMDVSVSKEGMWYENSWGYHFYTLKALVNMAETARRLGIESPNLALLAEIQLERIQATIEIEKPEVVVIDSIQTLYSEALTSAPGSVAQVRECAAQLTRIAKRLDVTTILVGHVTKEGALAGPRVLEHIVDTVLYFEGDTHSAYRLVRAFKNRFGAVNELGVFAMTERGLRGVANPSALFLSQHEQVVPGSCVLVTQEGTRPLLVEIQALVDTANVPNPRRLAVGLEQNRLAMLLAVLHRHAGIACFDQDVFLNAVGGVKITEPAADLAVLLAIHSSMRNKPLPRGLVVFGEIGLAGEIRPTPRGQERLKEAAKLGFSIAVIPKSNAPKQAIDGLEVIAVERIEQAIDRVRGLEAA
ncbi:MAG: DNA repair protein RadA [Ralstonia sp.]